MRWDLPNLSVLRSMTQWAAQYGDPEIITTARDLLDDATENADDQARRFASLLYRFVSDGYLTVAHAGYTAGGKMDMTEFDGSALTAATPMPAASVVLARSTTSAATGEPQALL